MRIFKLIPFFMFSLLSLIALSVSAQGNPSDSCPSVVQAAIQAADSFCEDTGRNEVCYGNIALDATLRPTVATSFTFDQPGDLAGLVDVQSLTLAGYDSETNEWGVAIMKVQANLPGTLPGQNVTFVLFGNVEIDNTAPDLSGVAVLDVVATTGVNLRTAPSRRALIAGSLAVGEHVNANGRLDDGEWLRVELPSGGYGWLSAEAVESAEDISTLQVVNAVTPVYGPMQAFYFRSGIGDSPCETAPDSGILVQTPEGAGRINLSVNGVGVSLGSTAFLTSDPGEETKIYVVEGSAVIESDGVTQYVPAGTVSDVPLSDEGEPQGGPSEPQPYDKQQLETLPLEILEREIEIADPLSSEEIEQIVFGEDEPPLPETQTQTDPLTQQTAPNILTGPITLPEPEATVGPLPPPPPPCSIESLIPADLTFINTGDYPVNIYWVDYTCTEQLYYTLGAGSEYFQSTFVTHPWRVRDVQTGNLILEWLTSGAATVIIP